jgi:hypothetical protein
MNNGKIYGNSSKREGTPTLTNRIIVHFFVVCNTVLLVFLCNMVFNLKRDVTGLERHLATKQDLATLKVGEVKLFHEERCTRCHTERKFTMTHSDGELQTALMKMEKLPAAHLTSEDLKAVHASLMVERCLECHSRDVLKKLALVTRAQRLDTIRAMGKKGGKTLQPGELEKINKSLETVLGF